ncbi:hypothetical protein DQY68_26450 [Salmonella enterica subsp. salamae]|nr:hypothetical protein [Salmonella enterica subsp. salamae]
MDFEELSQDTKECARETLMRLLAARKQFSMRDFEKAGECVAAAFIAMERFDGAPDECDD